MFDWYVYTSQKPETIFCSFLQTNHRPTGQQKQQLAEFLGLTLRKVVVFFSNHRVRGFGKKYSTGKSSLCSSSNNHDLQLSPPSVS
jgi:hypothetical protein